MTSVQDLKNELDSINEAVQAEFNGDGAQPRREQLDAHIATVKMVIDCLEDEAGRMPGYKKETN